ncbi:MAG: outer membrane protein assembly factor BamA [Nitrincola lacisaponensis]|uniref:Outer membrane protein assembly factor BamA n=1 Tax=Nitrincola lacisaponensis TaxID=267850 RepID=A0A063Y6X7_9GAMM|nr:outer membrane protein assembly factor BamA [Nitrincola lacisaponensis]KDE40486.1 Outer membrane protein assembly factor YaeT precursor [Nitrincola lacisaponensis]
MKRTLILILISLLWVAQVQANPLPFVVSDVRVEGLQQVDPGTVFRNFPIAAGDQVGAAELSSATRQLFRSGYFDDVQLNRDGDVLVLVLRERPAVAIIRIDGNKAIKTDQLREGLRQSGLQEGDVFRRATLDQIELDLMRVYASQGRYGADINTQVETLPGNRVALNINITEGRIATIQHINIVGNESFSDSELTDLFSLKLPNFWSFYTKSDQYSREKLAGDLERLRSHYLDRGYINFSIDSTQVSISPDKQDVFITVGITEGQQYRVGEVIMVGNLVVPEDQLLSKMSLGEGDVFSRREMTDSQERLERLLGDQGYMFANVSPIPQVNEQDGTISLRFFIEPGKLTYVRRVLVRGNSRSADEVVRREVEQMEAAIVSTSAIERSKQRLERTGHFRTVNVETRPVPGTDDQVDIEFAVEEQQSGQLTASVGFSQSEGIILQFGVAQENFLGTGKSVDFNISNSSTLREYRFNFLDPYFTVDGVSRGYNFYYREENFDEDDRGDYNTDGIGGGITFGYPIDDYQRLSFSGDVEYLRLKPNDIFVDGDSYKAIREYIDRNGDDYLNVKLTAGWSDNRLNRGFFPTRGYAQGATLEVSLPGSDLEYYRAQYNNRLYWPINDDETWIAALRGRVGYADTYGSDKDYPFFKNFYAGGLNTVRGFEANTLGPRYSRGANSSRARSMGGNVLVAGSAELIFPTPFLRDNSSWRTLVFMDAGNVFSTKCLTVGGSKPANCVEGVDFGELRYSAGVGLSWLTPIGPLSISLAKALNSKDGDETEVFQFVLGQTF